MQRLGADQMSQQPISTELVTHRIGPVAVLSINRPEKRNAMNAAVVSRLVQALGEAESDDTVLAVVLTGGGDVAFSAGADVSERLETPSSPGSWPAIDAASSFSKPLLAAVNGLAYGGGAVLALGCDLRIGCERSRFRFVGSRYGLVAGAAHLPLVIGAARAKEYLFTGRVIEPAEALEVGLLNRLVPSETLLQHALVLAEAIAENSPSAVKAAKQVVNRTSSFEEARALERTHYEQLRRSPEHRKRLEDAARRIVSAEEQQ